MNHYDLKMGERMGIDFGTFHTNQILLLVVVLVLKYSWFTMLQPFMPYVYMCVCVCSYIHIYSYFPSWSIPGDWIWFPVLYSRTSLPIHSKMWISRKIQRTLEAIWQILQNELLVSRFSDGAWLWAAHISTCCGGFKGTGTRHEFLQNPHRYQNAEPYPCCGRD